MMRAIGVMVVSGLLLAGCEQDMANQPRYEAYEAAPDWPDNQSARHPVAGTVARGESLAPVPETLPMPLTRELLEQGKQQYEIYCTPCHGRVGQGKGMVVQRGFPQPPSFHSERLRQAPLRHFYNVITDGYGVMYSYRARVTPDGRWAIAAYIRALQLSQNGQIDDLTLEQQRKLRAGGDASPPGEEASGGQG
jgi:cytochrome c553